MALSPGFVPVSPETGDWALGRESGMWKPGELFHPDFRNSVAPAAAVNAECVRATSAVLPAGLGHGSGSVQSDSQCSHLTGHGPVRKEAQPSRGRLSPDGQGPAPSPQVTSQSPASKT